MRRPKQTAASKTHRSHIRRLHKHRTGWYLVFFVGLAGAYFSMPAPATHPAIRGVLPYATNVNISTLASSTNQARAANGLGALALNANLNSGAQSKADHMIANNYWAHTAPDGTEPWHFFDQTGYVYLNAGENLAYGFDGSSEIVDAWMDSPGHRANVLGDYKDMGFGYASGENYQGGQYTVVVGFYGTQQVQAAPAPPSAPTPAVSSAQPQTSTPTPEPEPESAAKQESTQTPLAEVPAAEPVSTDTEAEPEEPQSISNLQNIFNGNAGWPMYASLAFVGTSLIGFTATHVQLVRRGWRQASHFILVHPALDAAMLVALIATLLTTAVGFIR